MRNFYFSGFFFFFLILLLLSRFSRVRLLATPWTAAHQAPPSMGFSRQEYWRGCHCLLRWLQQTIWKQMWSGTVSLESFNVRAWSVTTVVSDCVTPGTIAHQAPLSVGFFSQGSWSGLPCPSSRGPSLPGDHIAYIAGGFFTVEPPGKPNPSMTPS